MQITIDMPSVAECDVLECVYNFDQACHARAITVGDLVNPACDTYMKSSIHTSAQLNAGVGACKVAGCSFNHDFECTANAIHVGFSGGRVDCLTYSPT